MLAKRRTWFICICCRLALLRMWCMRFAHAFPLFRFSALPCLAPILVGFQRAALLILESNAEHIRWKVSVESRAARCNTNGHDCMAPLRLWRSRCSLHCPALRWSIFPCWNLASIVTCAWLRWESRPDKYHWSGLGALLGNYGAFAIEIGLPDGYLRLLFSALAL